MIPKKVQELRQDHRQNKVSKYYFGKVHFILNLIFGAVVSYYCFSNVSKFGLAEVSIVFATIILGSLVVYIAHRTILHNTYWFSKFAYKEHTLSHHFYFTDEAIELEEDKDYHRVLFSPIAVIFFLGCIGLPISIVIGKTLGHNLGYISFAMATLYYVAYEVVHTICHLNDAHWVFKLPFTKFLKHHHLLHHNLEYMRKVNFNVVLPIFDIIFGTFYRELPDDAYSTKES